MLEEKWGSASQQQGEQPGGALSPLKNEATTWQEVTFTGI